MTCPLCALHEHAERAAVDERFVLAYVYGIYAGKGPMLSKLCPLHDNAAQVEFDRLEDLRAKGADVRQLDALTGRGIPDPEPTPAAPPASDEKKPEEGQEPS